MSEKFRLFLDDARNGLSLNLSGRRIEIVDASTPTAVVSLSVIYPGGYTRSYYDFKKEYKAFSGEAFTDVRATNAAQAGEWVDIEVTQASDEWVYERRQDIVVDSITSPVPIDDTTPIKVDDDAAQALLTTIDADTGSIDTNTAAILAMQQDDANQRAGLTTLAGASYAEAIAATTDIVSAGANTNGIIIRMATLNIEGGAVIAYVATGTGTDYLAYIKSVNGAHSNMQIKDIFVPAGVKLTISSNSAAAMVAIWYEVL